MPELVRAQALILENIKIDTNYLMQLLNALNFDRIN